MQRDPNRKAGFKWGSTWCRGAFSKWQAPADETFHQFLLRLDGQGGYAVVEIDAPGGLLDAPSKFGTWNEFEMTPVIDIADGVAVLSTGVEFRESI